MSDKASGYHVSTHSGQQNNCVEAKVEADGTHVRDTKNRDAGTLGFTAKTWSAFMAAMKND